MKASRIPTTEVIRHWVSWMPADNCPDELIEHDYKTARLFDRWLFTVLEEAWEQGYIAGKVDEQLGTTPETENPYTLQGIEYVSRETLERE